MTESNLNPNELEVELVNESDLIEMGLEILDGSLELPPDITNEASDPAVETHLENAETAQAAADMAIEVGDYQSAKELMETAEYEAEVAGVDLETDGVSSTELEYAADHQAAALELQAEQAELAQSGDYSAAKEASLEAANEMEMADQLAGGEDHSGQAQLEAENMEWAEFHQDLAEDMVASAEEYSEAGNFSAAENVLEAADSHQTTADHYGDLGEHGGEIADFDPSSYVETNATESYSPTDTSIADTSTTDFSIDTSTDTSSTVDFSSNSSSTTDDFSV